MGRGLVGIIPKLVHKQNLVVNISEPQPTYLQIFLFDGRPVLVELDGKVGHMLQSLVGEGHVHVHVALATREGARDL